MSQRDSHTIPLPRAVFTQNTIQTHDIIQLKTQCTQIYNHLIQLKGNYSLYSSCISILLAPSGTAYQDYLSYATSNLYRFLAACQYHLSSAQKHFNIGLNPFLHKLYQSHSKTNTNDQLIDKFKMDTSHTPVLMAPSQNNSAPPTILPVTVPMGTTKVKPLDIPQIRHEMVGLVENTYATTRNYVTKSREGLMDDAIARRKVDHSPQHTRLQFENQLIVSATNINTQNNAYLYPSQTFNSSAGGGTPSESTPHRILVQSGALPNPHQDGQNLSSTAPSIQNFQTNSRTNNAVLPPSQTKVVTRKVQFGLPFAGSKAAIKSIRDQHQQTQQSLINLPQSPQGNTQHILPANVSNTSESRANPYHLRRPGSLTHTQGLMILSDILQQFPEYAQRMFSQSHRLQNTLHALIHNYKIAVEHFDNVAKINNQNANPHQLAHHPQNQLYPPQHPHQLDPNSQPNALVPLPPFPQAQMNLTAINPPMMDMGQLSQLEVSKIMHAILNESRLRHYSALTRGPVQLPLAPHFQLLLYTMLCLAPGSEVGKGGVLRGNFGVFRGWDYPTQTHYISTVERFKKVISFGSYNDPASIVSVSCNGTAQHLYNGLSAREVVFFTKTLMGFFTRKYSYREIPPIPYQTLQEGQTTHQLGQINQQIEFQNLEIAKKNRELMHKSQHDLIDKIVIKTVQHLSLSNILTASFEALYAYSHLPSLQQSTQLQLVMMRQHAEQHATAMGLNTTRNGHPQQTTIFSPNRVPTQTTYFEHLQYIYQRLVALFSSALHTASLLYTSLTTSCDIILITKSTTHSLPISVSYQQYSLPYISLLTLTQPTVSIEAFYKLFKAIFNLPVQLMTYQQYQSLVTKSTIEGPNSDQYASRLVLPLYHDSTTHQVICHYIPAAPYSNTNGQNNKTQKEQLFTAYQLPSIDIIGLNIIIPTAYQLYIPLHYSPIIAVTPTTPLAPYLTTSAPTPPQPNTQPQPLHLQQPVQLPLSLTIPFDQTLPTHHNRVVQHNITTLAPKSIHYSTIIDLSLRATLIPPTTVAPPSPSPLPVHPQYPYIHLPQRLGSNNLPMVLPYTTNIITFLQSSTSAPTYAQSITTVLPIANSFISNHMTQSLALPSHYKLLQTALQVSYEGYCDGVEVLTKSSKPILSTHSTSDHTIGAFYREMSAHFTRISQIQQATYKKRIEAYYKAQHDYQQQQLQIQQHQQQRPNQPFPYQQLPQPTPPTQPGVQLLPNHNQVQSIWNLVIVYLTHNNVINLLPFIILSISNLSKYLHPSSSPSFDSSGMSSSQYSTVPHTPDQARNPLWNTALDQRVTHLTVSLTTLSQPITTTSEAISAPAQAQSLSLLQQSNPQYKQTFVSTTYATHNFAPSASIQLQQQQYQHHNETLLTTTIPSLQFYRLEPKLQPFQPRTAPLTSATATPLYSVDLPPMLSAKNQIPPIQQQVEDNLISNKIVAKLTITPSCRRRPHRPPRPLYREWDYTPGFVEGNGSCGSIHSQPPFTSPIHYTPQPHRNTGDISTTNRFLAVEQFASLLLPANVLNRSGGGGGGSGVGVGCTSKPTQQPQRDEPMWYHIFDNILDLYSDRTTTTATTTLGYRRREWLAQCKPKAM